MSTLAHIASDRDEHSEVSENLRSHSEGEENADDGLCAFKDPDPASREWKNR